MAQDHRQNTFFTNPNNLTCYNCNGRPVNQMNGSYWWPVNFTPSCLQNAETNSYQDGMVNCRFDMGVTPQTSHNTSSPWQDFNHQYTMSSNQMKQSFAQSCGYTTMNTLKDTQQPANTTNLTHTSGTVAQTQPSQTESRTAASQTLKLLTKNEFHEPLQFISLFHLNPSISILENKLKLLYTIQEKPKPEFDQEGKEKRKKSKAICLTNLPLWFQPKHILLLILLSSDFNVNSKDYELAKRVSNGFIIVVLLFSNNQDCLKVFYGLHKMLSLEIATDYGVLLDFEIRQQIELPTTNRTTSIGSWSTVNSFDGTGERRNQIKRDLYSKGALCNELKDSDSKDSLNNFSIRSEAPKLKTQSNFPDGNLMEDKVNSNETDEKSNITSHLGRIVTQSNKTTKILRNVNESEMLIKANDNVQNNKVSTNKRYVGKKVDLPQPIAVKSEIIEDSYSSAEELLQKREMSYEDIDIGDLIKQELKDFDINSLIKQEEEMPERHIEQNSKSEFIEQNTIYEKVNSIHNVDKCNSINNFENEYRKFMTAVNDHEEKEGYSIEAGVHVRDEVSVLKNVDVARPESSKTSNLFVKAINKIGIRVNSDIKNKNLKVITDAKDSDAMQSYKDNTQTWVISDDDDDDNNVVTETNIKEVYVKNLPPFQTGDFVKSLVKEKTGFNTAEKYFFIYLLKEGECLLKFLSHEDAILVCRDLNQVTAKGKKIEALLYAFARNKISFDWDDLRKDLSDDAWDLVDLRKRYIPSEIPVTKKYGLNKKFLEKLGINMPLKSAIVVKNLHNKVDEAKLREIYSMAGEIKQLEIILFENNNKARIDFDHPVEAVQAISMFNKQKLFGKEMDVSMESSWHESPLPIGLSSIGFGLGTNGEPLKNVRANMEKTEMCEMFWELGSMSKLQTLSTPFETQYVRRDVKSCINNDNASSDLAIVSVNRAENRAKYAEEKETTLMASLETMGTFMKSQDLIPTYTDCRDLPKILEALRDNRDKITTMRKDISTTSANSEEELQPNSKKVKTCGIQDIPLPSERSVSNQLNAFAEAARKYRLNKLRKTDADSLKKPNSTKQVTNTNTAACRSQQKANKNVQLKPPTRAANVSDTLKNKLPKESGKGTIRELLNKIQNFQKNTASPDENSNKITHK